MIIIRISDCSWYNSVKMEIKCVALVLVVVLLDTTLYTDAHGYMEDPLLRSAAARDGKARRGYDDDWSCGGAMHQWSISGGRCGVCGDPYGDDKNKPNEDVGKIVATYTEGVTFTTKISLFKNELGWFEFRLCALPQKGTKVTQSCLDEHVLKLEDSSTRYRIHDIPGLVDAQNGTHVFTNEGHIFFIKLRLPEGVTCEQCVMQLWYQTYDPTGKKMPKTYVNCADIRIEANPDKQDNGAAGFDSDDDTDTIFLMDLLDKAGHKYPGLAGVLGKQIKYTSHVDLFANRGYPYPDLSDLPAEPQYPYDNRELSGTNADDTSTTAEWDTTAINTATASSTESSTMSATESSTEFTTSSATASSTEPSQPPVLAKRVPSLCDRLQQFPKLMAYCIKSQQRSHENQNWYGNRQ